MRLPVIVTVIVSLSLLMAASCDSKSSQQRQTAVAQRADTFQRAVQQYPNPQNANFPLRGALVKMTDRQDLLNHPWYIYILGDNGNAIGYYVGQTVPVNACDFLSNTADLQDHNVVPAPSLDGIYYGGSGSSSGCDAWFFFDYATDALIQIRGVHFFTADQPLILNAEPIKVQQP